MSPFTTFQNRISLRRVALDTASQQHLSSLWESARADALAAGDITAAEAATALLGHLTAAQAAAPLQP